VVAPIPASLLVDLAAGVAAAEPLWRAVVRHDPVRRHPVRLLATDVYEVWVIGWTAGQGLELHDHGASAGAVAVVEGRLAELAVRGDRLVRTDLVPGRVRSIRTGVVHDVVNPDAAPATSVHVYSPALVAMTHYDATTLRPVGTSNVDWIAPALPAPAGAALLHPSAGLTASLPSR
jgi:hypothetical protein